MTGEPFVHEILIIDDDAVDRRKIVRLLAPVPNIKITEAHSGEHAMQVLETLEPSLAITDIFMPNVDGLEFLTQLATLRWNFPVIAITGQNDSQHIDFLKVAQSFGAVHSLEKRELDRELAGVVRRILLDSEGRGRETQPYC
ncbi:MAG: response regulator transcription factor [Rhodospirillales bacterium]|nr:response regulator transcription factor [Rhodospirillales bacterium]MBO6786437.1 response regulator transcription factor [Rhodospirillales bacterium]